MEGAGHSDVSRIPGLIFLRHPLAPSVHLDHLIFDGRIAIADPDSRKVIYRVPLEEAEALILAGRVVPVGTRRKVKALHWIGPALPHQDELNDSGSTLHHRDKYWYKHETQTNPPNVYALRMLPRWTQGIFLAVAASCGGVRKIKSPPRRNFRAAQDERKP